MTDRIGGRGGGGESEGKGDEEEKRVDGYVAGRAEGDLRFPSSNSRSVTQGPRTMGTHHLSVLDTFIEISSRLILRFIT